jgi:diguanylate cyclase (GGDEF)-like protein
MRFSYREFKVVFLASAIFLIASPGKDFTLKAIILLLLLSLVSLYFKDLQKLESISYIDSLTQIYNRHKFLELADIELNRHIRYGCPLSFILLDLDNFKKVNDIYGHSEGDRVLKELSDLISRNLRKSDVFARWGGEEFIVMLPNANASESYVVAEKIRALVEKHNFGKVENITISLGISELTDCHSLVGTITQADQALYQSKMKGRNRVTTSASSTCGSCKTCTYV